ncbi:MAG: L,D-transpeptidase family protein [Oceanicoccus sp.]
MIRMLLTIMLLTLCSTVLAGYQGVADRVLVAKAEKKLYLLKDGVPFLEFPIALSPTPKGHKREQGDERTPEGSYILDFKNKDSDFYKSIRISYPNQQDLQHAELSGVDPGGAIMIHGTPNESALPPSLIQQFNWTDGCIAVTNRAMDEIWAAVETGTPIEIRP